MRIQFHSRIYLTGEIFIQLISNTIFIVSLSAWLFTQLLKGVIHSFKRRKFKLSNFIGAGGMPSSHTALVVALAVSIGTKEGWHKPLTAITLIFAFIVMYDSSGIRLAAGQQAITLNKIIDELFRKKEICQKRLRESLGHSISEVVAGALLGAAIAFLIMHFYL